ncbi:hypothetical protein A1O3_04296 [Capronia epimyces CBS 606.96]|uniref:Amino acid permease/ SLC12A domain-containing protein n=1 Tax=Capronia epimyces CBS 606.96 TaxID=1182542 RepID=W9Y3H9_9EURO|nr:uncharacterized protein A1O3_04296 [Capronia epimyces CBS 606.96]EXJ87337.1 hypothetical protein A1O3_04296 [Capronia epimyces CBS 606.96]
MGVIHRFLPFGKDHVHEVRVSGSEVQQDFIGAGEFKYTIEQGGNGSGPSYQEVSGAPVETDSPLGYSVGSITILFLNISMMIGTGVYSTRKYIWPNCLKLPAAILSGVGSVGLSFFYWVIGFVLSGTSLAVYLEYASYFPNRSGAEAVYLEQAYPRPKYLFPTTYALWYLILSFSSSNCIVLANYLFQTNGHSPTAWQLKGVAVAAWTVCILLLIFSNRLGYLISNAIGVVKLLTLIFVSITGLVVLGGHTRVKNPTSHFKHSFSGTSDQPYGLANGLVYIIFSYGGYNNAFNVVNEVKNPIKTIKFYSSISLLVVATLYILANVAYIAAVPLDELKASQQIAASLFFEKVFGSGRSVKGLNFLIALSAFGNLLAGNIGISRLTRECGRQGVLPFPRFWASTQPFGTPLGPYLVKYILTVIMILAPPAGDAFNFIVNLQVYPNALYNVFIAIGIYLVRWRRGKAKLPRGVFKAWDVAVVFNILVNLYMVVMPWYPPETGADGGSYHFWYGTSSVVGIAIVVLCGLYYVFWIYAIPYWRGYRVRQETLELDGGANTHRLTKVPLAELEEWDRTHDPIGREIDDTSTAGVESKTSSNSGGKRATIIDENEPKV